MLDLVQAQIGEEAELTEVDAEDGHLAVTHLTRGAKDGAVAAEDEREIGLECGEVQALIEVESDDFPERPQERSQSLGLRADAGLGTVAEDEKAHGQKVLAPRHHRLTTGAR